MSVLVDYPPILLQILPQDLLSNRVPSHSRFISLYLALDFHPRKMRVLIDADLSSKAALCIAGGIPTASQRINMLIF